MDHVVGQIWHATNAMSVLGAKPAFQHLLGRESVLSCLLERRRAIFNASSSFTTHQLDPMAEENLSKR